MPLPWLPIWAWRWIFIGALGVALVVFGWIKGNEHGTQKLADYQGRQAAASAKVITRQGKATERVVKRYVKVKGETEVVTKTVKEEVTKYVESKPLALACALDNRWLRLHDAAAIGAVPPTPAADDGASGAVTAAAALPGITDNYARAHRNEDKLTFCQNWVREQFKASNGRDLGY